MSQALRKRVVSLAPEGHQGAVKTKERLRTKVWWPGMDRDAEKLCAECYGCHIVTKHVPPLLVKPTPMPQRSWEDLALSSGYIGSNSVRRESVSPGGLSQQVDRGCRCQGNHK